MSSELGLTPDFFSPLRALSLQNICWIFSQLCICSTMAAFHLSLSLLSSPQPPPPTPTLAPKQKEITHTQSPRRIFLKIYPPAEIGRSLFQIFRLFLLRKVWWLIIVPERILSQNHKMPTSQTWTTSCDVTMASSYLKKQFFSLEKLNKCYNFAKF